MASAAFASEPPKQPDTAGLLQGLRKLGAVGSVLYVAAHPDDENTTLLSYLANDKHLRAAYLSMTRGDGGQNLIGSEQGDDLGIIRTQELLAARRIDGAQQFFTRAKDFGYSKTPEETLASWGKDQILADVVRVIRRFRPDVIITRFPQEHDEGQHGHHTASARLALEAFRAAADPSFSAAELSGLPPWRAKRIVWNKSQFFVKPNEDLSSYLRLDAGAYNPRLGLSYGEMAADSRSMHKSQGFGVPKVRGPILEYFRVIDGDPAKEDIFEGVDFSWKRFSRSDRLNALAARAQKEFAAEAPERIIPVLLEFDRALDEIADPMWKAEKKRDVEELIAACAGLFLEVSAAEPVAAPGGEWKLSISALNRSSAPLRLERIVLGSGPAGVSETVDKDLPRQAMLKIERTVPIAAGTPHSTPYWLAQRPEKGLFKVEDPRLIGDPENAPVLSAEFQIDAGGAVISIRRSALYKWTDPVLGERHRPLEIVPPISVSPATGVLMFPDDKPQKLGVRLKSAVDRASGKLVLEVPKGWRAEPPSFDFALESKGAEADLVFRVFPHGREEGIARAVASSNGADLSISVRHIEHEHIPIQMATAPSEVKLVPVELKRGGTRIGYIPGAGDEVAASLARVGYEVTVLGEAQLQAGAFSGLDAIVTGVRAYNTNPRMRFHHARLMEWVRAGGTVVVQYNTNNRFAKVESDVGPWPLEISRDRVTDESAPVEVLLPKHPLLNVPNVITPKDFEGWVQERGLYFAGKWDPRYEAPFSIKDPGEAPSKGSVLVAHLGKGKFIYTGLSFFRQLPAGVPGAHRLFANMIARSTSAHGH